MSGRSQRASYHNDEILNLSLTGSQISTPSNHRPASAKLKRPSSLTDIRHKQVKQEDKATPIRRKNRATSGTPRSGVSSAVSSHREPYPAQDTTYRVSHVTTDPGARLREEVKPAPRLNGNDNDFMALFESSAKPVIRGGVSNDAKGPKSPKKHCWTMSNKSALSNKTTIVTATKSGVTGMGDNKKHGENVFKNVAVDGGSSGVSDVEADNDWTSLDQISRVLDEANELLSSGEGPAAATTGSVAYPSITNNLSVLGRSPQPRVFVSSIENIKHKMPVNVVKQGQGSNEWRMNSTNGSRNGGREAYGSDGAMKSTAGGGNLSERSRASHGSAAERSGQGIVTDRSSNHGELSKKAKGNTPRKRPVLNMEQNHIGSGSRPTPDKSAALNGTPDLSSTNKLTSKSLLLNTSYQPSPSASVNARIGENAAKTAGYEKAEEYINHVNAAATAIQKWYLRHVTRRKAASAAMKRMLEQKRRDYEEESVRQSAKEDMKIVDRRKLREEKAQAARLQAIEELRRKREEKRDEVKRIANEQLSQLEAEGKVGRKRATPIKAPMTTPRPADRNSAIQGSPRLSGGQTGSVNVGGLSDSAAAKSPPADVNIFFEDKNAGQYSDQARASDAHTKTTLNDLLDTLKLLEQEEKILPTPRPPTNNHAHSVGEDGRREYLSVEKLEKLNERRTALERPGYLTDDKLKSIHSFLDEVETADRVTHIDAEFTKVMEEMQYPPLLVPSVEELTSMEQAAATANEVTSAVLSQKMELDEKKRTVNLLQKALNQQRELTVRHARESDREMKNRLDQQKNEYEEAVTRHLSFIDQLIDDKKCLGEKCEQMVKELKTTDSKYQEKIKGLVDSHTVEMKKLDEIHKAAEKLRREKWADDMTKKIKERTVKGLEPEIQRLIMKNKAELKKVKQIHEAELLEADERAAQRYVKMTEDLRDQLAVEKESACTRERELAKQRYEKQMQQEEESYQQQRRRLHSEVHDEKERLAQQAARQRLELDKLQRQLEDSHGQALDAMKGEFEKARVEQENRHATELRETKERLAVEKEAWEENYRKKQDAWLGQKERELKEGLRKERDQEIDLVISRLEEDSTVSRQDCERTSDNKIRRIREKYESEIRELEISEKQAIDKYNKMKAKVADVEGENERLKVVIKQKDEEVTEVKRMSEKLHNERDRVSDVVRQEYADRIVATEEENKHVKGEMSESRSRHKLELERMKTEMEVMQRQKDDEMEDVHKRVKQAITKKDEVVTQLKQQYQAAVKRADHLEGLLDQQRKLISK